MQTPKVAQQLQLPTSGRAQLQRLDPQPGAVPAPATSHGAVSGPQRGAPRPLGRHVDQLAAAPTAARICSCRSPAVHLSPRDPRDLGPCERSRLHLSYALDQLSPAMERSLAPVDALPAPAAAAVPAAIPVAPVATTAAAGAPPRGGGIDTTRVLNLFGFVGPVASLMTHTLYPGQGAGTSSRSAIQRMPGIGAVSSSAKAGSLGTTRFVLSRTEDAIDSVLPCAAERMFKRPGKFANPSNLHFSYQA